jgi:hypothetical protein
VSTRSACRRYAALPRTSSIGDAAAALCLSSEEAERTRLAGLVHDQATDPRARGQILNVIDGPGERIWNYLSDYMRGSDKLGWRLPVRLVL